MVPNSTATALAPAECPTLKQPPHLHGEVAALEVLSVPPESRPRALRPREGHVRVAARPARVLPPRHPDAADLAAPLEKLPQVILIACPRYAFHLLDWVRGFGGGGGVLICCLP